MKNAPSEKRKMYQEAQKLGGKTTIVIITFGMKESQGNVLIDH